VGAVGAMAAAALYAATEDEFYQHRAVHYAGIVTACQQQALTDWDVPMTGFFYQDLERDLIWHHSHMSYACMPNMALRVMCETFPQHPLYMKWYYALVLSGEYYRLLAEYTRPYGVIPAGVYHEDEIENHPAKVLAGINQITEDDYYLYKEQVRKGFPVGKGHYIRVYPVWFSFRGNYKVLLSESKAMSCSAMLRNDYGLYNAAQDNLAWIVGKNPFAQSTMYGEGYDYIQLYAVQPGQTVGALPVGMQSFRENDVPYWPQVCTATYKEVWICPPTKWMWCLADSFLPAVLEGYLEPGEPEVFFTRRDTGNRQAAAVHPKTGYFTASLPAGYYSMAYGGAEKDITVINGKLYFFEGPLSGIDIKTSQQGHEVTIRITIPDERETVWLLKAENLHGFDDEISGSAVIQAAITEPGKPWAGLLINKSNPGDRYEILDRRFGM
jgi:hypothetical protein